MKFWKDKYSRELCFAWDAAKGGWPVFGGWLPFLGWKLIPCRSDAAVDVVTYPPRFVVPKFGVQWFDHGFFYSPPWPVEVRVIKMETSHA